MSINTKDIVYYNDDYYTVLDTSIINNNITIADYFNPLLIVDKDDVTELYQYKVGDVVMVNDNYKRFVEHNFPEDMDHFLLFFNKSLKITKILNISEEYYAYNLSNISNNYIKVRYDHIKDLNPKRMYSKKIIKESVDIDDIKTNIKKSKQYIKYNNFKIGDIVSYNNENYNISYNVSSKYSNRIRLQNYYNSEDILYENYDKIILIKSLDFKIKIGDYIYLNEKYFELIDNMVSRMSSDYNRFQRCKNIKLKIKDIRNIIYTKYPIALATEFEFNINCGYEHIEVLNQSKHMYKPRKKIDENTIIKYNNFDNDI